MQTSGRCVRENRIRRNIKEMREKAFLAGFVSEAVLYNVVILTVGKFKHTAKTSVYEVPCYKSMGSSKRLFSRTCRDVCG